MSFKSEGLPRARSEKHVPRTGADGGPGSRRSSPASSAASSTRAPSSTPDDMPAPRLVNDERRDFLRRAGPSRRCFRSSATSLPSLHRRPWRPNTIPCGCLAAKMTVQASVVSPPPVEHPRPVDYLRSGVLSGPRTLIPGTDPSRCTSRRTTAPSSPHVSASSSRGRHRVWDIE